MQVLGCLMQKPSILSDIDKYFIDLTDFNGQLDKFVYSAIYNLYVGGATAIATADIDNYLKDNVYATELLAKNNGLQFIQDCEVGAELSNFPYYYRKLKKINLVRDLAREGYNISELYCDDVMNEKYSQINEQFERLEVDDIIRAVKLPIDSLENKYTVNSVVEKTTAADGIRKLVKELKEVPEVGEPLQGEIFNTVTRGARLGKLYLRSGGTGVGKTRGMVADACQLVYPIRYDSSIGKWVSTGESHRVLYIMTEQDPAEIQTMILAYLTDYNEDIFLYGTYDDIQYERIEKAIALIEQYKDNMLFARIPDPCSSIVKNTFREYNLQHGVEYFFYDYIFSSPAMLNEYRDLKVREDGPTSSKQLFH